MAVRGARPLPTKLKFIRGTLRKGRTNVHEPALPVEIPRCPPHLSAEAKREWKRVSLDLAGCGLLTRIDRAALALYCEAWGRWVEAEQSLRQYGVMIKSPSGFPMQSPYLAIANKAMEQMRAMLGEFGMSPSSRTRVHAEPVHDKESPLEALRRRGEEDDARWEFERRMSRGQQDG
jgi:P27 family predicted phage terminase small subunit